MTGLTGAIEYDPLLATSGGDNHRPTVGYIVRDVIGRLYGLNDLPTLEGSPPLPERAQKPLHADHVCSRNGVVIPRPIFPEAGWQ